MEREGRSCPVWVPVELLENEALEVKKIEILGFQISGSVCNLRIKFIAYNYNTNVSVFVIRKDLLVRWIIDCCNSTRTGPWLIPKMSHWTLLD
jgi:hypothetical protein